MALWSETMPNTSALMPSCVRRATPEDVDSVARLFDAYRQFYAQEADLPLATKFMHERLAHNQSFVFLAENQHREALGFCQLYPTFCSVIAAPICTLYDLFVQPQARKTGMGQALLLAAQNYAQSHGYARLDLTTAKTNLPAQSLYTAMGWERDTVFYAYSKQLSAPQ
jgi:ribosomal protein S18 acetylase RimI-like enzyme